LSNPVTDTTAVSSLIAATLVSCTYYYVFPSRKDGRKDISDEKTIKKK